jgi:hypothetical protein
LDGKIQSPQYTVYPTAKHFKKSQGKGKGRGYFLVLVVYEANLKCAALIPRWPTPKLYKALANQQRRPQLVLDLHAAGSSLADWAVSSIPTPPAGFDEHAKLWAEFSESPRSQLKRAIGNLEQAFGNLERFVTASQGP